MNHYGDSAGRFDIVQQDVNIAATKEIYPLLARGRHVVPADGKSRALVGPDAALRAVEELVRRNRGRPAVKIYAMQPHAVNFIACDCSRRAHYEESMSRTGRNVIALRRKACVATPDHPSTVLGRTRPHDAIREPMCMHGIGHKTRKRARVHDKPVLANPCDGMVVSGAGEDAAEHAVGDRHVFARSVVNGIGRGFAFLVCHVEVHSLDGIEPVRVANVVIRPELAGRPGKAQCVLENAVLDDNVLGRAEVDDMLGEMPERHVPHLYVLAMQKSKRTRYRLGVHASIPDTAGYLDSLDLRMPPVCASRVSRTFRSIRI